MTPEIEREFRASQKKTSERAFFQKRRWSFAEKHWGAKNFLQKYYYFLQDRMGWFRYQDWIRTVENREIKQSLSQASLVSSKVPSFCFALVDGISDEQAVMITVESLEKISHCAPLVFILSEDSAINQEYWFRDLLVKYPGYSVVKAPRIDLPFDWVQVENDLPGDWVIPLQAGDRLSPRWLDFFRIAAAEGPDVGIFYWDEDEIDHRGKRINPFFKPDWSPELLFSVNYLETAAFKMALLARFRQQPPSSLDARIFWISHEAKKVAHIPFVLHHRLSKSTDEKNNSLQQHAVSGSAFLNMQGFEEVTAQVRNECLRLQWKSETPRVSIIIPTKNNYFYIQRCLSSLIKHTRYPDYEIILMDDHSTEPEALSYYQKIQSSASNVRIYENEEAFNYSRVNNNGARLAKGDLLLFLNNDVEILDDRWLEELVRWCLQPGVGMVGAKLLYPEGTIQHAGIVIGMTGHAAHLYAGDLPGKTYPFLSDAYYRNVSAVTGACMLVRRVVFEAIGGFDENLSLVFNDVEIGLRMLQYGYRIVYTPFARLIHYEGRSRAKYIPSQDIRLGAQLLHATVAAGDRYYNQNLSLAVNWPTFKRRTEPSALARLEKIVHFKG